MLLPMGAADDGAHSQNEKIDIRNYIEGTKSLAAYLYHVAHWYKHWFIICISPSLPPAILSHFPYFNCLVWYSILIKFSMEFGLHPLNCGVGDIAVIYLNKIYNNHFKWYCQWIFFSLMKQLGKIPVLKMHIWVDCITSYNWRLIIDNSTLLR